MEERREEERREEERREEEKADVTPTPPEIPEEIKVESEWADTLGMDYDAEKAANQDKQETPAGQGPVPPVYVMPAGQPLPPEQRPEPMPPTCMVWAILSLICCCLPASIVAIIFSAQVSSKYFARDYEGARKASEKAQLWIIISIVLGIIVNALYMPLSMMMSPGFGM